MNMEFKINTKGNTTDVENIVAVNIDTQAATTYTNIEELLTSLATKKVNAYVYNLGFYSQFIIAELVRLGYGYRVMRKAGQGLTAKTYTVIETAGTTTEIYEMSIKTKAQTIRIRNVSVIYPVKEEKLAKLYKGEYPVALAMKDILTRGYDKMTIGGIAEADWKKKCFGTKENYEKILPPITREQDNYMRQAYHGGWCFVNKKLNRAQRRRKGKSFDVNSMYPAIMVNKALPCGRPVHFEGEYVEDKEYPLWIARVIIGGEMFLREGKYPCIHDRWNSNDEYGCAGDWIEAPLDDIDMIITSVDWQLINECYVLGDYEFVDGYKFKEADRNLHAPYINEWYEVKRQAKTEAEKTFSKLMLNNISGKFASKMDRKSVIRSVYGDRIDNGVAVGNDYNSHYLPIGCFITAYGRQQVIQAANAFGDRFLYADTDSVKVADTTIEEASEVFEVNEDILGAWKDEGTFVDCKFLGPKKYILEMENGAIESRIAGLPDEDKEGFNFTIDSFYEGRELPINVAVLTEEGCMYEKQVFTL